MHDPTDNRTQDLLAEHTREQRHAALAAEFETQVGSRAQDIDPSDHHDWHSLTLGWLLAKGLPIDEALTLAVTLHYRTTP